MPIRYSFILVFTLLSGFAVAQNGTIGGRVVDYKTKEGIIGASVVIQGTTVGGATDVEGNFLIANVKPGTYVIVVSYIAYKTQTIPDVVVEAGNKTTLTIDLPEDVAELQEIVITAKKEIATDVNLLNSIKEMKMVVSGISSEQIVKLPDRDAAQIAQRVSGVTITDNRFILVRGVPERYNQVMINGIIGPSTEIDKRSFSFDLIPAGLIDQLLVFKSPTAELPGDFAGGMIKVITKQPSYDEFTSIGFNVGFRTNTTFQDFLSTKGSGTDILGFDNGFRELPGTFPGVSELRSSPRNSQLRETAGKSLTNNFALRNRQAPVDFGFNVTTSQKFSVGKVTLSNLTAVAYSNSYQRFTDAPFLRYNDFQSVPATLRFEYRDNGYFNDTRVTGMHNWLIDINDRNRIEFKNLFVQLGENETIVRSGDDKIQNPNFDRINYAYHYLSRSIYSGQLEGVHKFGDGSARLDWVVGMNWIRRNEPDYRRFRTFREKTFVGTEEPFQMQLPPSGNLFETGRFWSNLVDRTLTHALNFEKKFGNPDEKRVATIKAGYLTEYRTRSFSARYMNYLYPGNFDPMVGQELIRQPLTTIFSPGNISRQNGFVIEEGTQPQDAYEGTNFLNAGYVSAIIPVGKFDLSAGFRAEYNIQQLSALTNAAPVNVDNPVFAALPSVNVAYNLSDRSLLRMAYGRTVNRPEFRELAPFLYYQFELEAGLIGSPTLKTSFVDNLDLRYEIYPNPGEMFSVGVFLKNFKNPIESYLQITTENPQFFYGNALTANTRGVEVEFRKSLASLGVSKFLRNTSFNFNGALIKSNVDIGTLATNQVRNRPLQGQSPYVVNFGLYYSDDASGWSMNAAYNVFGQRIFSVGDFVFPSWIEMPRHALDFQVSKTWGGKLEVKVNLQNALNAPYRLFQDNNSNNSISGNESLIQRYRVGSQVSLGLNWKFMKE